jgi:hypothetical protein
MQGVVLARQVTSMILSGQSLLTSPSAHGSVSSGLRASHDVRTADRLALLGGEHDVACPSMDGRRRDAKASGDSPDRKAAFTP